MVPAMAGQLLAEPSIRHQKERSFFPFFGEEERSRSFRSRIGSAQPTAGQPKAGKLEAARVGREGGATVSVRSRGFLPRRGQETPSSKLLAANRTEGCIAMRVSGARMGPRARCSPGGQGGRSRCASTASEHSGGKRQSLTHERGDCIGLRHSTGPTARGRETGLEKNF